MVAKSRAWVYGLSLAGISGLNHPAGIDVCHLRVLRIFKYRSLRQADHSTRGVLPSVVCLSVIEETQRGGLGPTGMLTQKKKRMKAGSGHWINNVTNISDQQVSSVVYEDSFKNNVPRRTIVVVICVGRIPTIFRV